VIFLHIAIAAVGAAIALNVFVLLFRCFLIEWRYFEELGFLKNALKFDRTEAEKRTIRRALISMAIAALYFLFVLLIDNAFFENHLIDHASLGFIAFPQV